MYVYLSYNMLEWFVIWQWVCYILLGIKDISIDHSSHDRIYHNWRSCRTRTWTGRLWYTYPRRSVTSSNVAHIQFNLSIVLAVQSVIWVHVVYWPTNEGGCHDNRRFTGIFFHFRIFSDVKENIFCDTLAKHERNSLYFICILKSSTIRVFYIRYLSYCEYR